MNWPPRRRHKKLTSRDLVAAEVRDGHTQSVRGRWFLHGHEHRNDRGACGRVSASALCHRFFVEAPDYEDERSARLGGNTSSLASRSK